MTQSSGDTQQKLQVSLEKFFARNGCDNICSGLARSVCYYFCCVGVVVYKLYFATRERTEESRGELHKVLLDTALKDVPLLIFATKAGMIPKWHWYYFVIIIIITTAEVSYL